MKKYIFLSAIILPFLFFSCAPEEISAENGQFFKMEEFVLKQASNLQSKAGFHKTLIDENGQEERKELNPDWKKELEIFKEFELNKSSFIGEYDIDSTDLSTQFLLNNQDGKPKIKSQEIFYGQDGRIYEIRSTRVDDNPMFYSKMQLFIRLDDSGSLMNYVLSFNKKVILLDSSSYKVVTQVVPFDGPSSAR